MKLPPTSLSLLCLPALALLGACATPPPQPPVPAEFVLQSLEQQLLGAQEFTFAFHITAEGVVQADLQGVCSVGPEDVALQATGEFATMPLRLAMISTPDKILGHTGGRPIDVARGPELREAVVLGLTRMGLLHNIAKLFSGAAPDHQEGGVAEWTQVEGVFARRDGTLAMRLIVDDEPAGEAVLALDPDGLPSLRTQTVRFSTGTLEVTERYSNVRTVQQP